MAYKIELHGGSMRKRRAGFDDDAGKR